MYILYDRILNLSIPWAYHTQSIKNITQPSPTHTAHPLTFIPTHGIYRYLSIFPMLRTISITDSTHNLNTHVEQPPCYNKSDSIFLSLIKGQYSPRIIHGHNTRTARIILTHKRYPLCISLQKQRRPPLINPYTFVHQVPYSLPKYCKISTNAEKRTDYTHHCHGTVPLQTHQARTTDKTCRPYPMRLHTYPTANAAISF